MAFGFRRLPPGRAEGVEARLRARAEQLKPIEQLKPRVMPLGLCRSCEKVVYSGDRLAMAGLYLFHHDCVSGDAAAGGPVPGA